MRHVQRLSARHDRARTIVGVMALVAGLALFSLARAPGANGQLISVGVGNSGSGTASTGGNEATGNSSSNDASAGGTSGGLIGANVNLLGGPSNTSSGTADVTTGPASAAGNTSGTGSTQTTDGGSTFTPFFSQPAGTGQAAGVTNEGSATASTGGNTAVGNNSDNTASLNQTATGGLIAANVNLLGGPSNTSTGTATINTGAANAAGNTATTNIAQTNMGGGFVAGTPFAPGVFPGTVNGFGSSLDPCSGRFFPFSPSFQSADVANSGNATASTGGNHAIGNNSTNNASVTQSASGGLIGININLGGPTNNSTGTATINTGAANASGNSSTTSVNQLCAQGAATTVVARNPITGAPFAVPVIVTHTKVHTQTLARTGLESSLALVAAALVLAGMALLLPNRRKLAEIEAPARARRSDWDDIVRW